MLVITNDLFNVADRDAVSIAMKISLNLKERFPDWDHQIFSDAFADYNQAMQNQSDVIIKKDALVNLFVEKMKIFEDKLNLNDGILLVFDSFEVIEVNPLVSVLRAYQLFPDDYGISKIRFLVAGRSMPDWTHPNWINRDKELKLVELKPFSEKEMIEYLGLVLNVNESSSWTSEQVESLHLRTSGRPIFIGLVSDVLNKRIMTLDEILKINSKDFSTVLVSQINNFENPISWIVLFMAHVSHRFNAELLSLIFSKSNLKDLFSFPEATNPDNLLRELRKLSFVRQLGDINEYVLHDEMTRLVNQFCWNFQDPDGKVRRELSLIAVEYYDSLTNSEENLQLRDAYIVEALYHNLYLNLDEGVNYYRENISRALSNSDYSFANALLREVLKYEHLMSFNHKSILLMTQARLLLDQGDFEAALRKLKSLGNYSEMLVDVQEYYFLRGTAYMRANDFSNAVLDFNEFISNSKNQNSMQHAEVLNRLGYVYRRQGYLDKAMRFYETSLEIYKNTSNQRGYAGALTNIANIYRIRGDIEEALRMGKIALRFRRELNKIGGVSEQEVALSLTALGLVYFDREEVIEAEKYYREAFEIYSRTANRRGIASIYNRLSEIKLLRGDWEQALSLSDYAYAISSGVFVEIQMNSLYLKGLIFESQKKISDSKEAFLTSLEYCKKIGEGYFQVKNLIGLASLEIQTDKTSLEYLSVAEKIVYENNYNVFIGEIEFLRGEYELSVDNVRQAFRHFGAACRNIALHNEIQYPKALRKITDLLLDLPKPILASTADMLISYWIDHKMDTKYPEFVEACSEVNRFIQFD